MDQSHEIITIFQLVITALAAIGASSGFWVYMDRKKNNRSAMNRLLIGLAHDRIVSLSLTYIERGLITQDEYENLHDFLYEPYKELGGNGSANRLMKEVKCLPMFNRQKHINDRLKGEPHVSEEQNV